MIKYLETFFAEKDLPEVFWELKADNGERHFIGSAAVIRMIGQAPEQEQIDIADVIRKIDFVNGDVNDYLKHLAGALING